MTGSPGQTAMSAADRQLVRDAAVVLAARRQLDDVLKRLARAPFDVDAQERMRHFLEASAAPAIAAWRRLETATQKEGPRPAADASASVKERL